MTIAIFRSLRRLLFSIASIIGLASSPFLIPHSAFRVPHSPFPIPHSAFPIPPRRLLPVASAIGLAFTLVWLLAAVTRPAQASAPQAIAASTLYVKPGGSDSADCLAPEPLSFPINRGPCATIQRAIDLSAAGDIVRVARGTYDTLNTKGGLSQVVYIDKQVTVEGGYDDGFFGAPDFSNPTVIDAGNGGRGSVITGTAAVTVRGFRVINGNASAPGLNGNGGGMLVDGSAERTIEHITVENSTAARGGGLYVQGGSLVGSDVTLQQNSATARGGALYVAGGTANISGGAIDDNSAPLGGGVYAEAGQFALTGSTLRANSATDRGGGIFVAGGTVVVGGGEVSGNSAPNGGGGYAIGGELHLAAGTLLQNNTASGGEGQSLYLQDATAILTGTTVQNHIGATHAIYAQDSFLRLGIGSSLLNNSVTSGDGGAIYASGGGVELEGVTATGNRATTGNGGVLYAMTATLTVVGSTLTQNSASDNGGALYLVGGTAALSLATLDSNRAGRNGGAVYARGSAVTVGGGSVSMNTALNGSGGGFFVEGGSISLAQNTRVADNQAGLAAELAISADVSPRDPSPLQPVAYDISLSNNGPESTANVQVGNVLPIQLLYQSHTANGGTFDPATGIFSVTSLANGGSAKLTINAIPIQEGTFTDTVEILRQDLYDPITTNNSDSARVTVSNPAERQAAQSRQASGDTGGAASLLAGYALDSVYGLLQDGGYLAPAADSPQARLGARAAATISANGGGLAVYGGRVTLADVVLDKNQAVFDGGGLYASDSQVLLTGNNTFSDNGSSFGNGGGLSAIGGTAIVQSATFQGNSAINGGGLYASDGFSVTVAASIFDDNSATSSGGGLYVLGQASQLQANTISKNVAGQGGGLLIGSTQAIVSANIIDQNRSSLATTVSKGRAVGAGAGVYIIGTAALGFYGNRVTNNTVPYETITRLLAIVEDRVVIEGTDPPTIIEPGPQYETKSHVDNGGGLYMQEVTGTFTANIFLGNSASGDGGGLYIVGGKLGLVNDLIVQNRIGISIALGSAILISGTDLSLINTTIADNQHQNLDGDGRNTAVSIFGKGSKLTILNSIVANHEVGVEGDPANSVDGTNNVWWNNSIRHWGKDLFGDFSIHLFGDPQFVDPAVGDYRIQRTSAAFDAGVATAVDFGWAGIATDLAGGPRLRAFAVDAGAYEHRYTNGLYLTQQPSERIVADGLSFTYIISVANHSPSIVANVSVQDVLPSGPSANLRAISISSSRGVCNLAALSCSLGAIGPEEVIAVTVLVQAHGAPPPNSMLAMVNHVTLSTPGIDPTQTDTDSDDTTFLQLMYAGGAAVARAGDVVHTSACRVNLLSEVYDDGLPYPNGKDYTTVQAAVNASARKSDIIRVSGYCGVSTVNLQVKLTIQGGWSTDMTVLDPVAYPTTLDAGQAGPVLRITEQTAPTVENLALINGSAPSGGCIYIKQSSVTLRNIQMRNCTAISKGGGLYVDRFSKPVLVDSLIENSSANAAGAGIYIQESGAEIKNTIIRNNTGAADGGGIYLKKSDTTISDSTISGHTVTADGGGIYLDGSAATVQNNTISDNAAPWAGGGIFADNSPATISFNRIENNSADGVPVYVDLFLFKIDISGGGGGIYGRKSDMRITNNRIIGNSAPILAGAGIHLWNGSQPQIDGNVVAKNTGNGIFLRLTPPVFKFYVLIPPIQPPPLDPTLIFPLPKPEPIRMRHNTIHANTGAGVLIFGRTAIEMTDNIITANGKGVVGVSDFYLHIIFIMYAVPFVPIPIPIPIPIPTFYPPAAELDITLWGADGVSTFPDPLSFVFGEWSEGQSIAAGEDPGYKDPASNDFHIKRISPAFQSGLNTDVATDFDAEERVQGEIADLGADEYTFRETRYATPSGNGAGTRCDDYKNPCSIQKALDAAEDGDLIKVAGGTYTTVETRHELKQIAYVERQVTIQGGYCATTSSSSGVIDCDWEYPFPAKYPVIFDAGGGGRAMVITNTVAPEIFDILLTGGDASAGGMNGQGGGLYVFGSSPVLSNVVVYGNKAQTGGGIYLATGASSLASILVRDNTAADGGGIAYGEGSLGTVISATITGNSAERGGGVYFTLAGTEDASAALLNSTISGNSATIDGGGLYAIASKATVEQNLIDGNTALSGGGVFLGPTQETSLTRVLSNTVSSNSATQGGGFYLDDAGGAAEGNTVQNNSATQGGGFYIYAAKSGVTGNIVIGNRAADGGGFYMQAAPDANVVSNLVTGNSATSVGGGFVLDASSSSLSKNEISANAAETGGGLYLVNFSAAKLNSNRVLSNTASADGGGAYLKQSPAQWKDNTLRANTSQTGSGGGLYAKLSAMLFENSQVEGNTTALLGGGLYLDESNTLIQSSFFYTNSAGGDGGGLYIYRSSEAKVVDSEVRGNQAGGNGGGLVVNDSNSTLKNLAVAANRADAEGGGLYLSKSIVQSDRLLVRGNSAANGAGLYLTTNSSGFFYATALVDNQADGGAGALYMAGSSPTFYQTTIARNRGSDAVTVDSFGLDHSTPAFINTIIAEQPVALQITSANSATLEATLWHGVTTPWIGPVKPYTGTVNIYADPQFSADGYHIVKASPALNNGVETKAATDIDGDTMPQFSIPDIGADEVPVECAARLASNPAITYGAVQTAVDAAAPGDLVKVAGTCKGVSTRNGQTQSVYLDKSVHIRGGYDALNWEISYPLTQPTTIAGLSLGRVFYITGAAQPTIENLVLRDGSAASQGGGPDGQDGGGNVYVNGASATFSNTQVLNGSAYYGGGIFLYRSPSTIITNTFSGNKATAGGVIFAQESAATLTENLFSANGATSNGGAVFLSHSPAVLVRNNFRSNNAATAGGAVFADSSPATLLDNTFFGNKAKSAGAVYLDASDGRVEGNRFEENTAESAGALLVARSTAQITANQLFKNTALNGGGLYLEKSDAVLTNNLVISNTASNSGSGLYSVGSTPQMLHNTFAYNSGGDGSALSVGSAGSTTSRVTFQNNILAWQTTALLVLPGSSVDADGNLWYANTADVSALGTFNEGSTRLAVDPAFVDAATLDFHLRSDSPAINVALASAVDKDFEGQPRPTDSAADIGSDEYYAPDLTISAVTTPEPALAGSAVFFNFQAVNLGNVPLHAAITATLPAVLTGAPSQSWPDVLIPVGDVWTGSISRTIPVGYAGPLEYALFADTVEGVSQALTQTAQTVLPNAAATIVQSREPAQVLLGQPVRVRIEIQNVGNRLLTLTVTDTLPTQTEPTGILTWTNVSIPSTGSWVQTITMTPTSAAQKEMVNRIDVSDELGFVAFGIDTATIGEPALSVSPLLQPNPVIMGEPFTLTFVVANTGDVAQATVVTSTIRPEFLGDATKHAPRIEAQTTVSLAIPYLPTSHVGSISITVQLISADGISITEVMNVLSILRPLEPTIASVRSGPWSDPTTWQPQRLPDATDVVLVNEGHEVNVTGPIALTSFLNKGVLICPSDRPLVIDASVEIQNIGEIRCNPAADGAAPGADGESGSAIQISTSTLYNEGSISGGDGGSGATGDPDGHPNGGAGGAGGAVKITTNFLDNVGSISAGGGGNGTSGSGNGGDAGDGGAGGPVTIEMTSPTGELLNEGIIEAGNGGRGGRGGSGTADGGDSGAGGSGGPLEITGPTVGETGDLVDVVNLGTMQAGHGGAGGNGGPGPNGSDGGPGGDGGAVDISGDPDGDGAGAGINVENGGAVLGGNGGAGGDNVGNGPGSNGGNGGDVKTVNEAAINDGLLQGGSGGDAGGTGAAAAGSGGDAIVLGGQIGPGLIDNLGTIAGGAGGAGSPAATTPQSGGNGGDVVLVATPEMILDGGALLGGDAGGGSGGAAAGDGGDVTIATGDGNSGDPPTLSLAGPDTRIVANNLTISGGTLAVLELIGLDPNAISLSGQSLIALGPGSEVDLSDNSGLIFVAGQFAAYADKVTLLPGVSLDDLVSGPVTVQGSFFRYDARLFLPGQVNGFPGARVVVPALLVNLGPLADSYRLEGSFGTQAAVGASAGAWTLGVLPSVLPVPGNQTMLVPLTVTIPFTAEVGSRQTLVLEATSYTDGRVQAVARTVIAVGEGGARLLLPYISRNGSTSVILLRYLPLVTTGGPVEVIVGVETESAPEVVEELEE